MDSDATKWPVKIDIPLLWGDMDSFGHVNNIRHLSWFETARMVMFEKLGMDEIYKRDNIGIILARTDIDYVTPLYFPDSVECQVRIEKIGNTSFTLKYRIFSKTHDMQLAAIGTTVMVMYDYNTKQKVKIPATIRQAMQEMIDLGD